MYFEYKIAYNLCFFIPKKGLETEEPSFANSNKTHFHRRVTAKPHGDMSILFHKWNPLYMKTLYDQNQRNPSLPHNVWLPLKFILLAAILDFAKNRHKKSISKMALVVILYIPLCWILLPNFTVVTLKLFELQAYPSWI